MGRFSSVPSNRADRSSSGTLVFGELIWTLRSDSRFAEPPAAAVTQKKAIWMLVPEAGIEPARHYWHGILSPGCLPVSPFGQRADFNICVLLSEQ